MKQSKMTVFVKDLSIRIKREVNEGNLHVRTTIILSLLMTFSTIVLGMFVHDRIRKFMSLPEDSFFPPMNQEYSSPSNANSNFQDGIALSSDSMSSNFLSPRVELTDWITPKEIWHSMSDDELLWRASLVPHVVEYPYNRTRKLAFMFLTKGRLPLAPLWERFFKGYEGLYSIYLHTSPEYTNEPQESSMFYKRRIPSQVI